MRKHLFLLSLTIPALLIPPSLRADEAATKRLHDATLVIREMGHASDNGIPQDLLEKARCIIVVPGLKKVAFIGGGKFGRGYASCVTASKGWSAPAAIRVEGGSFGLQLGASSTDVIMLVMNEGGMRKLMADKFTLGGEANAAAGPVGRTLSANTDAALKAEILSYSRSRGLFAGLSLEGATLRPDADADAQLYGTAQTNEALLTGQVKRPAAAAGFLAQLQRFSGKGAPPAPKKRVAKASTTDANAATMSSTPSTTAGVTQPDNTKMNKTDRGANPTADNSKNNSSDVQIAARIRRSIVADKSLSTYGHNVKVIVKGGSVTLKGPVHTDAEKSAIEAKATDVAGAGNVVNQIDVLPAK